LRLGGLSRRAALRKNWRVQKEGGREVRREIEFYKLDAFLKFNEYEVLTSAGSVSAEVAKGLAEEQFATFRIQQDQRFESDFEKEVKRIEKKRDKEDGP
jgi:hypothetical protein